MEFHPETFFALKKKNRYKRKTLYFFEQRVYTYSYLAQRYFARKTIGIMTRGPKLAVYYTDISRGNLQCSCLMSRALAVTHCFASAIS